MRFQGLSIKELLLGKLSRQARERGLENRGIVGMMGYIVLGDLAGDDTSKSYLQDML